MSNALPHLVAQASRLCLPPLPTSSLPTPSDAQAIDLVRTLVEIPSTSGEESGVARAIVAWCAARHIPCEIDAVGNAVATFGPPDAPRTVMLLGHMDTFPGMPPVRLDHGILHGRGSVDAKGPLAAFLVAAARAHPRLTTRVIVAGAVEEECPTSRGARHIAATYTPDACIIGEPSGCSGYTLGYKGRLVLSLCVDRQGSHSAGPDASAADEALAWWSRVLSRVDALNASRQQAHTPLGIFDRLQAGVRSTHSNHDGITDTCTLHAGFRLPTWLSPEALERELPERPQGAAFAITGRERAIRVDRSSPVARALAVAIRAEGLAPKPVVKTGTSDMNVVGAAWTCPIAAYGPGDSALDHTPHEHLVLDEYLTSIRVLTRALESGLLVPASPGE
ncbi:MAG: [LysW]-lysine hydrolase [Tepidisphaera sp.]|nr:[LysW]-lysine hydrolase [Tepidisphaera sp.]